MNAILSSEFSQPLINKFEEMDALIKNKTIIDGNGLFSLDKNLLLLAAGSLGGMIVVSTVSIVNNSMASLAGMELVSISAFTVLGAAVLGSYNENKNTENKRKIKKAVLEHQYGIHDFEEITALLKKEDNEFFEIFKDAIYNKSIESIFESSNSNNKIQSSILSIREKVFKTQNKNKEIS